MGELMDGDYLLIFFQIKVKINLHSLVDKRV